MAELTRERISAILVRDATVSDEARGPVLRSLDCQCPPRLTCGEREAARILGVGTMTLGNLRRGRRNGNPTPFPFGVHRTPSGCHLHPRFSPDGPTSVEDADSGRGWSSCEGQASQTPTSTQVFASPTHQRYLAPRGRQRHPCLLLYP